MAVFPFYDNSGCLIFGLTGATAPTASVYKDGGAGVASTCAVSELNANAGIYQMKFTSTEMTADVVAFKASASSASARDAVGVMYTVTRQLNALAFPTTFGNGLVVSAASGVLVDAMAASTIQASSIKAAAIEAAGIAASTLTSTKFGSGAIVADTFVASAITAANFALTAGSQVWNAAVRTVTGLGASTIVASTFGVGAIDNVAFNVTETLTANPAASGLTASSFKASAIDSVALATGAISVGKMGASAIGASNFAASAISQIVWTDGAASRVLAGVVMQELGQAAPGATPTLEQAMMGLYMAWRNSASTSSGCIMITNDAGTVVFKAAISDSGSVFERAEWQAGP